MARQGVVVRFARVLVDEVCKSDARLCLKIGDAPPMSTALPVPQLAFFFVATITSVSILVLHFAVLQPVLAESGNFVITQLPRVLGT